MCFAYFFLFRLFTNVICRIKQTFKINIRQQICQKFGINNPNDISRIDPANLDIPHFKNFQKNCNVSIYGTPEELRWQMQCKYLGQPRYTHVFNLLLSDANTKRLVHVSFLPIESSMFF